MSSNLLAAIEGAGGYCEMNGGVCVEIGNETKGIAKSPSRSDDWVGSISILGLLLEN
jgi:hypothetical protein